MACDWSLYIFSWMFIEIDTPLYFSVVLQKWFQTLTVLWFLKRNIKSLTVKRVCGKNILVPNSGDMNKNDTSAKHAFTY